MEKEQIPPKLALEEREYVATFLQKLLASSYALYLKTQNYHWNVKGMHFISFHLLFQKQYEELQEVIDEMAERIRALGFLVEASFSAFSRLSLLDEVRKSHSAQEMVHFLLEDHETLIAFIRKQLPFIEKIEDGATADFLNKRLISHEKTAWMLRSTLSD